ncbi:MAG: DNA repair and recombination protein RadB [Methanosarcinales archaeon Met12]|nr:MAG: DNA repair and recombination protein RadB [Methanosarcinales archaeon Met12]
MKIIKIKKYTSGCGKLDELLGGGFESGTVTQLFGEAGSGKTNICLQLAIETVKSGKKVIFVDSEGFSAERFKQIAGDDAKKLAEGIIIYEPMDFEQQYSAIKDMEKVLNENIGVIILDSATLFYRAELVPNSQISRYDYGRGIVPIRELAGQVAHLLVLARKYDVAAIITNQVYTNIDDNQFHPLGGNMMEHLSKNIIQLEKIKNGRRRASIRKHRSQPEGISCEFVLTRDGVKDI